MQTMQRFSRGKALWWLVFSGGLLPLLFLIVQALFGTLGFNPVETINRFTGDWAFRFLLIALAVTPLRVQLKWTWLGRFRRMLGLYAFFYMLLHLASFIVLDHFFDVGALWQEILQRPFITVGAVAILLTIPLAVTSLRSVQRKMKAANWKRLHKTVYLINALALSHFFMMVKADYLKPQIYTVILVVLLGVRIMKGRLPALHHLWR
ncbi:protein-methionine-sulfoxide reductase heme-binding subunit MsrQ [Candidatus Sororendozoicomonas aggregata]|uniref:sulfite oxidase heme-binding subunit YedZ n=1 Tax=Candidatus Sororendozoicomonas aggregata TaxID=3073239 RepID=UPI002ED15FC1